MVSFITYDLIFLAVFAVATALFLYSRRANPQRQGIMFLYRTKIGVRFIEKFTNKFRSVLRPGQYAILASGYILMASILWMLFKTTYLYLRDPLTRVVLGNTPPVFPLIPYFPQIFGLESLLPPLYFTYFIIALAIVAVVHEFSHGIYMRFYNFKIKSTGFAFLGPILGAFVEQEEKQFNKAKKIPQMVVLGAGTFANILLSVFFGLVMMLFFASAFVPVGVSFDSYALDIANSSEIIVVGNSSVEGYLQVNVSNRAGDFFVRQTDWDRAKESGLPAVYVFLDSPAFQSQMVGAISEINGQKTESFDELNRVLQSHSPGETVEIKTVISEQYGGIIDEKTYEIQLGENDGNSFVGVSFFPRNSQGFLGFVFDIFSKIKDPSILYESKIGDFGWFIYYLLWWIVTINFFVALFNMLPLGILDGGRYFYLTVWGLTRNENVGKKAYKFMLWFLLLLLLVLMISWIMGF